MKILIYSVFHPSTGGIESMTEIFAEEFIKRGHDVKIVTPTKDIGNKSFGYDIYRCPNPITQLKLLKWCDIFMHQQISLKYAWPLIFLKKHWVIVHQTWIHPYDKKPKFKDKIKLFLLRFGINISVSKAISKKISVKSKIIHNTYDSNTFHTIKNVNRDKDLIFLGRLVSDKGVDTLIESLKILKDKNYNLTIIGDGEEKNNLIQLVKEYKLNKFVNFVGIKKGEELNKILNEHKVIVIPSRWPEPFGIVALEGTAAGCVPIVSDQGGLSDAIGNCGLTFDNGNSKELANQIEKLLSNEALYSKLKSHFNEHLKKHSTDNIIDKYIKIIKDKVKNG